MVKVKSPFRPRKLPTVGLNPSLLASSGAENPIIPPTSILQESHRHEHISVDAEVARKVVEAAIKYTGGDYRGWGKSLCAELSAQPIDLRRIGQLIIRAKPETPTINAARYTTAKKLLSAAHENGDWGSTIVLYMTWSKKDLPPSIRLTNAEVVNVFGKIQQLANFGNYHALMIVGRKDLEEGRKKEGIERFTEAAGCEEDDGNAALRLAGLYEAAGDKATARGWYEKAKEKGNPKAILRLALLDPPKPGEKHVPFSDAIPEYPAEDISDTATMYLKNLLIASAGGALEAAGWLAGYYNGIGMKKAAGEWTRLALESGHVLRDVTGKEVTISI